MTEPQWLKAADGDPMLKLVEDRLSPRKWTLLACGVARRLWDILPEGPFREAILWREATASGVPSAEERATWDRRLEDATLAAVAAAEQRQREIVKACDPDADDRAYQEVSDRRVNPAVPLYVAASADAASAIESAGRAVQEAADAVRLFAGEAGPVVVHLRRLVVDAQESASLAGMQAAMALDFFARGNDVADRGLLKNPRIEMSRAEETVRRLHDAANERVAELHESKQEADRKGFGKLLLEQVGNPFREYRFEPAWRTEAVVGLARAIDEDRAFDRYPILLDALLDADCDEEAILRHVRGTEKHATEPVQHAVGCWVIDLILDKEPALFAGPPLTPSKSPSGSPLGLAIGPMV